jgi:hypothetical protein
MALERHLHHHGNVHEVPELVKGSDTVTGPAPVMARGAWRVHARAAILIAAAMLPACEDENMSSKTFNVFFYYPSTMREEYLGEVRGLSQCGASASARAAALEMNRDAGWSYICCLKTASSSCAEKHR